MNRHRVCRISHTFGERYWLHEKHDHVTPCVSGGGLIRPLLDGIRESLFFSEITPIIGFTPSECTDSRIAILG